MSARDELAKRLQAIPADQSVLFVVDGVPDAPAKPLRTWCPGLNLVTVLATSRRTMHLEGAYIKRLELQVLSSEAAVDLLTLGGLRNTLTDEEWRAIVEWVGRLPLALELMQRALQFGLSPQELLKSAKEETPPTAELDRLLEALRGEIPDAALLGVAQAFVKSYELLPDPAKETARLVAQFSPEPIPNALLKALGDVANLSELLLSRSFVTRVEPVLAKGRVVEFFGRMHKLLADFLRAKVRDASDNEAGEISLVAKALAIAMHAYDCSDPKAWPVLNACIPHARHILKRMSDSPASNDGDPLVRVSLNLGMLYRAQGALQEAKFFHELALKISERVTIADQTLVLAAMRSYGNTLYRLGDFQTSRTVQEKTIETCRRILGPEDGMTVAATGELAMTLQALGKVSDARQLLERVVAISTRKFGERDPNTIAVINNLAFVIHDQGDLQNALKLQTRVLELQKEVLDADRPDVLTSMRNLASLRHDLGDLEGARQLQEQIVEKGRRILGSEHSNTLTSMNDLAQTLKDLGRLQDALKLHRKVLDVWTRELGPHHPDTLTSKNNFAQTLEGMGEFGQALILHREVFEDSKRVLGRSHRRTLASMNNVANSLRGLGRIQEAVTLHREELKTCEKALGPSHPDTLVSMTNLATILDELGDLKGARQMYERSLPIKRRVLGIEHEATTHSAWELLTVYRRLGDRTRANQLRNDYLKWLIERPGRTLTPSQRPIRMMVMETFVEGL